MTAALPHEPAIRINPFLHWFLSAMAAGVAVLVSSPLLPEWWRLAVGVADAVIVLLVARSQPRDTPAQAVARTMAQDSAAEDRKVLAAAGRPSQPPMARRPRRWRRGYLSGWVLLVVVLLSSGCLSLWRSNPDASPSEFASCPTGKVCAPGEPGAVVTDCESIASTHDVFVILAGVFGGVATASGAAAASLGDYPNAVIGLGAAGAGSAALGITFGSLAAWEADRFTRWCGGNAP